MSAGDVALAPDSNESFFGHPKGLFYLAFTEAWERFSYVEKQAGFCVICRFRLRPGSKKSFRQGWSRMTGGRK